MPPFTSLTDAERWDVVAYAFSLSRDSASLAQGEALYRANCAACHGETGLGDGSEAASLQNSPTNFTDPEIMAVNSSIELAEVIQSGAAPDMPAFGQLSQDEVWALADYIRGLSFAAPGKSAGSPDENPGKDLATSPANAGEAAIASVKKGVVSGKVTNVSGGPLPENGNVLLRGFDNMEPVITESTTLVADGSFRFEDVEMPAGRVFLATIEYDGAAYGSDIFVVEAEQAEISLPINIYESTTDTSILVTDRLHLFFEFVDETTLRVIQLYIISNPTNLTLVPESPDSPTVDFILPAEAVNLEIQDGVIGERFIKTQNGFGDTVAVRPGSGSYQVLYAYELPYKNRMEFVQPLSIPANAVVILAPEGVIRIKGEQVEDAGVRDVEGTQYHMYNMSSLIAGAEIHLTISGKMTGAGMSIVAGDSTSLLIGGGVFGVVLLTAGGWLFMRSRSRADDEDELKSSVDEDVPPSIESQETLMDAILALDDLYQEGRLPKEAYQERRAALKARLREVVSKNH
jgi:mono/diheme cytochrome c family protein